MLRAPVAWELPEKQMGSPTTASKATEKMLDREMNKLVAMAYETCSTTLRANRALMQDLVDALLEHETVDAAEFEKMVAASGALKTA